MLLRGAPHHCGEGVEWWAALQGARDVRGLAVFLGDGGEVWEVGEERGGKGRCHRPLHLMCTLLWFLQASHRLGFHDQPREFDQYSALTWRIRLRFGVYMEALEQLVRIPRTPLLALLYDAVDYLAGVTQTQTLTLQCMHYNHNVYIELKPPGCTMFKL